MQGVKQRTKKARAAERRAFERAILRRMRSLWIREADTTLTPQVQATLLGLEIARRQVRA